MKNKSSNQVGDLDARQYFVVVVSPAILEDSSSSVKIAIAHEK
jgi:hypothetical protein